MAKYFVEAQNIFGALHAAGFEPKAIYDVGSATGSWSSALSRVFPKAEFFLFEPLVDLKPNYQKDCSEVLRSKSNFHVFRIALSDVDGTQEMFSDEFGWGASLLPTHCSKFLSEKVTVAVNRLETMVSEQQLPVPDLLKMDVQGAELGVLRGAGALLSQVQAIQAEVWFRRGYGAKTPLFHEVSGFLEEFGFSLLEVCSPYYSPGRDLTAADAFFLKSTLLAKLADRLPRQSLAITSSDEPLRAISEFSGWEYRRLNARRLEHLSSLGLPLTGKKVWEVSAGIGDLTSFFLDRQCEVTISDVRPVLLEIIRDRFPKCPIERVDLTNPSMQRDSGFDIVFCYGVLYHVEDPSLMLAFLAGKCQAVLLLETCVSPGDELAINPVEEDKHFYSQAFHGVGCRPTRRYVFEELKKHFPFVYVTAEQPRHEQFPVEWDDSVRKQRFIRSVFVAARCRLNNPKLLNQIPLIQRPHGSPDRPTWLQSIPALFSKLKRESGLPRC